MHISLAHFVLVQAVDSLLLGQRRQGTHIADLGLAAGEHSGAMYPGNDVHFGCQRTDLGNLTAIGTLMILQNHLAHGLLLILIDRLSQQSEPLLLLSEGLLQLRRQVPDVLLSGLLVIREDCHFHLLRRHNLPDLLEHFLRDGAAGVGMLGLAHLSHDFVDKGDDGLVDLMGLVDGLNHLLLRNLVGAGLDHDDLLFGGSHGQVQVAVLPLLLGRIDYKLTVHHAHLGHGTGAVKGDVRNAGGNRRTQHGNQLRAAGGIHAHDHVVQGHVIAVILGEQRAHGPVDDTAGQYGVLAGLPLSLVEAAGYLAHRIQLLLKLHAQREKVDSLSGLLGRGRGAEHHRVPVMHERTPVGLLAYTVDIDFQCASGQFHLIALVHNFFLHSAARTRLFSIGKRILHPPP